LVQAVQSKWSKVKFNLNFLEDLKFAVSPQSSSYYQFSLQSGCAQVPIFLWILRGLVNFEITK